MNSLEQAESAAPPLDYAQLVDSIVRDHEGDQLECGELLAKIDEALNQIDEALDAGVVDEESLLVARETLIGMRLDLPCRPAQSALVQVVGSVPAGAAVSGPVAVGGPAVGGGVACVDCAPVAVSSGGGAGGGAGGAAAAGGPGLRRLLMLGGLTGGIIAAATSGDDNPPPENLVVGTASEHGNCADEISFHGTGVVSRSAR